MRAVVFIAVLALGGACAAASAATSARTTSVKNKACPVKRVHESKRARTARRACVARRKRAARKAASAAAPKLVAVPPPAVGAPVVVPAPPETPSPAPVASALGVDAFDLGGFVLRLTRVSIPAGTLTIYYRNRDASEHNLWIEGPAGDAPVLVSGAVGENGTATKRVAVSAGTWSLYCSLPGHEAMRAAISVG